MRYYGSDALHPGPSNGAPHWDVAWYANSEAEGESDADAIADRFSSPQRVAEVLLLLVEVAFTPTGPAVGFSAGSSHMGLLASNDVATHCSLPASQYTHCLPRQSTVACATCAVDIRLSSSGLPTV